MRTGQQLAELVALRRMKQELEAELRRFDLDDVARLSAEYHLNLANQALAAREDET